MVNNCLDWYFDYYTSISPQRTTCAYTCLCSVGYFHFWFLDMEHTKLQNKQNAVIFSQNSTVFLLMLYLLHNVYEEINQVMSDHINFVGQLQEHLQKTGLNPPMYSFEFFGHSKETNETSFVATVKIDGSDEQFTGPPKRNKKQAAQAVAQIVLEQLKAKVCESENNTQEQDQYIVPYKKQIQYSKYLVVVDLDNFIDLLVSEKWTDDVCIYGFMTKSNPNIVKEKQISALCYLNLVDNDAPNAAEIDLVYKACEYAVWCLQLEKKPTFIFITQDNFTLAFAKTIEKQGFNCKIAKNRVDLEKLGIIKSK